MQSVAIYSPKGGAGKSTIAVNLAHLAAATSGRKTLLWDIDAQGAASFLVGADPRGGRAHKVISRESGPEDLVAHTAYLNLDLLAADASLRRLEVQLVEADARKRLRKILRGLAARYDRIIIDCPPGLTEISEQIFRAVDLIVVPVQPSLLGVRGYEEAAAHIRGKHRGGPEILPVISMIDGRRKLHREMVAAHPDWPTIPQASIVEQMSVRRAPLGVFARRHPAMAAFDHLWADVEGRLIEREKLGHTALQA
jgi:cellulose biosynthesis protein BcsQ